MEAELVAIENYYIHSRADQKIRPEDLKQPVADLRVLIAEMRTQNEQVRNEVSELNREATVAVATGESDRNATLQLTELMKRERDFFGNMRPRLAGKAQSEFDQLNEIITRADTVQTRLLDFDKRVEGTAAARLAQIREKIDAEKVHLASHNQKLGGILGESQDLGGGLAHVMLTKVTERFYDLVVQSDVGLVDVSWGLKDYKTSTLNKLINQQKLELKSVEDDFKSLLEEEK
jgi:signal transduction histidine kinase